MAAGPSPTLTSTAWGGHSIDGQTGPLVAVTSWPAGGPGSEPRPVPFPSSQHHRVSSHLSSWPEVSGPFLSAPHLRCLVGPSQPLRYAPYLPREAEAQRSDSWSHPVTVWQGQFSPVCCTPRPCLPHGQWDVCEGSPSLCRGSGCSGHVCLGSG